jgi:hypothetical protein
MNNTLKFDGKSTYVEVEDLDSPTNNGGAITIEFWNKVDNPKRGFAFTFKNNQPQDRVSCFAPWPDDNKLYWDCGEQVKGKGRLSVDYRPYIGKWTHIALVSEGVGRAGGDATNPSMAIYINGKLSAKDASRSPDSTLRGLVIGAWFNSSNMTYAYYHNGMIDEFRVWNRVRTPEEIQRDMHAELIGDEPGLVACFNFNWGIANTNVSWLRGDPWKTLPNSVDGSPDGSLQNFRAEDYVASTVRTTAPIGPVFRLTKGDAQVFTTSYREKHDKTIDDWTADADPAFFAYRAPAPGTTPLYRLQSKDKKQYLITASRTERQELDPRLHVSHEAGDWAYDNEIAYVSTTQNGGAVPLYRGYNKNTKQHLYTTTRTEIVDGYEDQGIMCYVLPSIDGKYQPKSISFMDNKLSEQLWYVLVCRSYKEGWGVKLDDQNNPVVAEIPRTGDYTGFQWRLEKNRLINRAAPDKVLTIADSSVGSAALNTDDGSQLWTFTPASKKGTDCFSLAQGTNQLSCSNGNLMAKTGAAGDSEQWTLIAMEPVAGYTIPGPPAAHSGLPYNKYLPVVDVRQQKKTTIHVLGTGTVSDWAMLRVKLIVENMVSALKDTVDVSKLDGVEVIAISQDDSNEELDNSACIGYLHTEEQVEATRGGAHGWLCYVTEEMMWKTGVYHSQKHVPWPRYFDQVVHEFGHVLHQRLAAINENNTPVGKTPKTLDSKVIEATEAAKKSQKTSKKAELYAMSVQSWFNSIAKTDGLYYPMTRAELEATDPDRYAFLERHFDPGNTWMPPIEPRRFPQFRRGYQMLDGGFKIELDESHGNLKISRPNSEFYLGTYHQYKWEMIDAIRLSNSGEMSWLGTDGKVVRTISGKQGRWPFRLAAEDIGKGEAKLVVKDGDDTTLYTVLPNESTS